MLAWLIWCFIFTHQTCFVFWYIDCLDSFTRVEELQESELYYCPCCKKRQHSTKKLTIQRLPNVSTCKCDSCLQVQHVITFSDVFFYYSFCSFQVLCLHLKRFKFVSFHRSKIDTPVEFPLENLDMKDYVLPSVVC